jgi:hypothetical protein
MSDEEPKRRAGTSVYSRRPLTQRQEPRRIAETDESGRLKWTDNWREQATGWWPLDAFLRVRR